MHAAAAACRTSCEFKFLMIFNRDAKNVVNDDKQHFTCSIKDAVLLEMNLTTSPTDCFHTYFTIKIRILGTIYVIAISKYSFKAI
jgi:hypothetical protein